MNSSTTIGGRIVATIGATIGKIARRPSAWGLLLVLAAGAWAFAARASWLPAVAIFLDVGETPRRVDYVIVLPGDEEVRPFVAAALLRKGYAQRAIVIESFGSPAVQDALVPPAHEVARRVLEARGALPATIIALPGGSTSTFGDALAVRQFLGKNENATAAIVTSHFHTRRSRWVFRRVLGEQSKRVYFVSAPTDEFSRDEWWTRNAGLRTYGAEYSKFGYYLFRYGDKRAWGCVAVASGLFIAWRWRSRRRSRGPDPRN